MENSEELRMNLEMKTRRIMKAIAKNMQGENRREIGQPFESLSNCHQKIRGELSNYKTVKNH